MKKSILLWSGFIIALLARSASAGQVDGASKTQEALATRAAAVEAAANDPSLRSAIATPTIEFSAEFAEDKKKATAKTGFAWKKGLAAELGFSGAFNKSAERSRITSLRELSSGSSGWLGLTYKRYRVRFNWIEMATICRQAGWAAGERFLDFDCDSTTLGSQSFAARIAELTTTPNLTRGVCQQFLRFVLSPEALSTGADFGGCENPNVAGWREQYSRQFTDSIQSLYETAGGSAVPTAESTAKLEVCNRFRRSRGLPADAKCDPSDFSAAEKVDFAKSWQDRFSELRNLAEARICDNYRFARGESATETPGCTPAGTDPLFYQSFKDRFDATSEWLWTPIVSAKAEVSRATFNYRDDALDKKEARHSSYSVTGTVGALSPNDVLMSLNYRQGKSYQADDSVELCESVSGHEAMTCADAILGAPSEKPSRQLELQLKGYLSADVAAQLFVTVDFKKDNAVGFEVPIHFMKNKDGGLAGGLVLSYRTDKKRFEASVFVGQVFSVF